MTDIILDLDTNADDLAALLGEIALKQIPYAALRTTHELAFAVRDDVYTEMEAVFHKPTPFTLHSVEVDKGRKVPPTVISPITGKPSAKDPSSTVELRDHRLWRLALTHQFTGGVRKLKRIEESFKRVGLLPPGMYMVPTTYFPMDAYDNPRKGELNKITSFFAAFGEQGYKANMTAKTKAAFLKRKAKANLGASVDYFVSKGEKGLHAGIWQRLGDPTNPRNSVVRPLLLFISTPKYRRLIHLPEIALEVVTHIGIQTFATHLRRAIASDRTFRQLKIVRGSDSD